ncbi:LacI family transcriptional regulator [Nocardia terpenica]|uniref:LacI family transcriptional regulator n=2 Tax=Nocardia terpenica TaxID=455432 RepID=A0A164L0C1_9NOCA|nr:LacI family transcriptional regulator [Nocardia terpenica]NQE86533.1 LacI family transcriptional regulator [Nocardia terpenica]
MADVAAHAGVSRALVSLAFRDRPGASAQTRDRIFRAADELGYRPDTAARLLARSHSGVIGVVVTMRNLFHADLVDGIYPIAAELGYDILLAATAPTRNERQVVESLLGHRCEGLILLGPTLTSEQLATVGRQVPTVAISRSAPGTGVGAVHAAEAHGVRQVIDYLVELGHTDIAHIDGGSGSGSAARRRAYRTGMQRHGLADRIRILPGDHTEASGLAAATTLLTADTPLPTAVFASNDRTAVGLLDGLRRDGLRPPRDISIVGYDDSPLAQLIHIDLTTVNQDPARQAEHAVRALADRLENPDTPARDVAVQPKLVVRGTSGPPPNRTDTGILP